MFGFFMTSTVWTGTLVTIATITIAQDSVSDVAGVSASLSAASVSKRPVGTSAERTEDRWTQAGEPEEPGRGRSFWNRWWRGSSNHQKNHDDVKLAYKRASAAAGAATAEVFVDGKSVGLATLVEDAGYLVTKASLLEGGTNFTCRFSGAEPLQASFIGSNQEHDLALLKIDGSGIARSAVSWRGEPASPGTLVAALDADGEVIGVGVISTEPRPIRGTARTVRRRAWLGVSLGGGESGIGVTEIVDRSPAQQAGLRGGDQIQGIDGTEMKSMEQIIATIGGRSPGETVSLLIRRDGEVVKLSATLGRPPDGLDPQDQWGGGPFSERREGFPEVLTHDTIIRPDQCGGPLIDTQGRVVGVNIARALRVTTYAVPAATVERLVAELKKN